MHLRMCARMHAHAPAHTRTRTRTHARVWCRYVTGLGHVWRLRRRLYNYQGPELNDHTTYHDFYDNKGLPKQPAPMAAPRPRRPLEGMPHEHDVYRKFPLPQIVMREAEERVSVVFDSDTKYHADFTPKSAGKGKSAGQETPLSAQKPMAPASPGLEREQAAKYLSPEKSRFMNSPFNHS